MRNLLARLRAALTPQALCLLLLALLLLGGTRLWGDSAQTALEKRVSRVLSDVAGAGRVDVVIKTRRERGSALSSSGQEETPVGAVAVAQGADDPLVCMELQQALCALLGLPASAVSVVTGGG